MSVQILVEAAVNKQSSQFMEIFEKIILSKVAEKLNERRQEAAQNLFKEAATIIPFPKKAAVTKPGIKPPVKPGSQTTMVLFSTLSMAFLAPVKLDIVESASFNDLHSTLTFIVFSPLGSNLTIKQRHLQSIRIPKPIIHT